MDTVLNSADIERGVVEGFLGVQLPPKITFNHDDLRFLYPSDLEELMLERPPFFFIEKAVAVGTREVWGVAWMSEERSAGHFPGKPIVPLIELCKSMAQTGIILVSLNGTKKQSPIAIKAGESEAHTRELVRAPAMVLVHVTLTKVKFNKIFLVDGATYLNGKLIGSLFQIQYVLMSRKEILR